MLNQISLYAENAKGALYKITSVLAENNINIYTMLANDSAEFGIIRLITTEPQVAIEALRKAGYQCRLDKVIALEMDDTPGYLDKILKAMAEANVTLSYLYISYDREASRPVAIFKADDPETETFLLGRGALLVDTF